MRIINHGEDYQIYGDNLRTFDKLPPATYRITFNPMSGFSLIKIDDFKTVEEKVYGNHREKIAKVLNSYAVFDRSLGIILSGDKGMGKSLFVQLLAQEVVNQGMPVVTVTKPYDGVAEFIDRIDQEALVIFDEFEKVFDMDKNEGESQNNLLGLFDGTSQRKRLYAVTVNNLHRVSEFMVNRTGRFHYHIRFDYPSSEEIETYLRDKVGERYYHEIKHVVAFSSRVKLNYDSLRAIAFELNQGYPFKSAIGDLNILKTDRQRYDVKVTFSNHEVVEFENHKVELFSESVSIGGYARNEEWIGVTFDPSKIRTELGKMIVDGDDVSLQVSDENQVYTEGTRVKSIIITHRIDPGFNYKWMDF